MPGKKRPLSRDEGVVRDASLLVIASEDTHAVRQYFAKFRTTRVQYVVLSTEDGCSSPGSVLQRLDDYRKTESTEAGDQHWICIDRDHWASGDHARNLARVLQECRQKGYGVAISDPCFELWLLLHFADLDSSLKSCDDMVKELRKRNGVYQKNRCDLLPLTPELIDAAVDRAKSLDVAPEKPMPTGLGTRVYRLIEELRRIDG